MAEALLRRRKKPWLLKTGNFVVMTSNTAPTGFSVEINFSINAGGPAYVAFDNNSSNFVQDNNLGFAYVKLNFNKTIIPKKVSIRATSPTLRLIGIKEDNSEVILLANAVSATYTSFNINNDETQFKAIKLQKNSSTGAGFMAIYGCQITEWYEK